MSFKFVPEENQSSSRQTRFPEPDANEEIHWWAFASPEPAYTVCVVRLHSIVDARTVVCTFFDPISGKETDDPPVSVDVSNNNHVWRRFPSTIGALNPAASIGTNSCAILCFSDEWLAKNAPKLSEIFTDNPGVKSKYPFGEDGMWLAAVKGLVRELREAGRNPFATEEVQRLAPWLHALGLV